MSCGQRRDPSLKKRRHLKQSPTFPLRWLSGELVPWLENRCPPSSFAIDWRPKLEPECQAAANAPANVVGCALWHEPLGLSPKTSGPLPRAVSGLPKRIVSYLSKLGRVAIFSAAAIILNASAAEALLIDLDNCFCDASNNRMCFSRNEEGFGTFTTVGKCETSLRGGQTPLPRIEIRADVNRDGKVSINPSQSDPDERGEDSWSMERGALLLANLDDDQQRGTYQRFLTDGDDEIINGPADLHDLVSIRILPMENLTADFTALSAEIEAPFDRIRIFRPRGDGALGYTAWNPEWDRLTDEELRSGVELLVEAKDVAKTPEERFVDVRVKLEAWSNSTGTYNRFESSDSVRLRIAPVIFHHHLEPATRLLIAPQLDLSKKDGSFLPSFAPFVKTMTGAAQRANIELHTFPSRVFTHSVWIQDEVEFGYMSAPRRGGGTQTMEVVLLNDFRRFEGDFLGKLNSGPERAAIYIGDSETNTHESLEGGGNFEVIPPYEGFPHGRVIRGSASKADPALTKFLKAQDLQPELPFDVDSSWLKVAHIDELFTFVPAPNSRGWAVIYSDPRLGRDLVLDLINKGQGEAKLLNQLASRSLPKWRNVSLAELKNSPNWEVLELGIGAAESSLNQLVSQLNLDRTRDIISVPVLFLRATPEENIFDALVPRSPLFYSFTGNIGNGVVLGSPDDPFFVTSLPDGPRVNGIDVFQEVAERAIESRTKLDVLWVDSILSYHVRDGNVHCGSNTPRARSAENIWTPLRQSTFIGPPERINPKRPLQKASKKKGSKGPKKRAQRGAKPQKR